MKNIKKNIVYLLGLGLLTLNSCGDEFLTKLPQGELSQPQIENQDGVEANLLSAYGIMNGNINGTWGNYGAAPSQWVFGEMPSDNAHKGSEASDQPNMNMIEGFNTNSTNDNLSNMWRVYYEGVLRVNNTLKLLAAEQAGTQQISADRALVIQAEGRMLRAHYYFYLWRVFKNIPYVDENTTYEESITKPNTEDVLPKIIDDLEFAVANLPVEKVNGQAGRMNKAIAQAYLGKVLLYQKKYPEALVLFNAVMTGKDITTMPYQNNFDVTKEDGPEAILVAKHAINSDGGGDNANVGDMLNSINGSFTGCCGFFQPSIDLVNAFKVDANGLPFLDNSYRTNPYLSDLKITNPTELANYKVNVNLAMDPRLDYTVGRRGVQYLDWGIMAGNTWVRSQNYAGPFVGIKSTIPRSEFGANAAAGVNYLTGLDVNIIRLADVYLMAAECNVEMNDLPEALRLVNAIRTRAANLPHKKNEDGVDAAKYNVKPYLSFTDQDHARRAVRFERRLELAMEGHRFFDLVRWGVAKQTIESYSAFEGQHLSSFLGITFQPSHEYWPIPQGEIDRSNGSLTQNTGY
ncbi:RagB/SusD family nutrient uptake outer membrane protein [Sphingobacterium hungaricum]|uniref:RagB/SusD family nutrient uptake outer membrane protein n=1 Tax=Sphingobacterium hungaricum TaxID=2082723 RepID=A0A928YQF0_9SPHI|nr:RagB/SusD family nutrient uptake outer membrane protein [Sphingobacterium hungaricum]MBE8712318.1 RagB/SusD family nutrient uptake outer membrane protein [Sphingobacterium hungaricum]